MTIVMCDMFFFARLIVDQSHTRAAERCSAPGSTCEVRMPERVACQSGLAWARRPRRLTPFPWPAEDVHVAGLQVGRASWREEAQYDVNFSFMAVIVPTLAWMLAVQHGVQMWLRTCRIVVAVMAQPFSDVTW